MVTNVRTCFISTLPCLFFITKKKYLFSFLSGEIQQPADPGHCLHLKGPQANKDC